MKLFIHFCVIFLLGVSFAFCCSSSSEDEKSNGNNKHFIFNTSIAIKLYLKIYKISDILFLIFTADNGNLLSSFTLSRRTLDRFRRDHKDNKICWDRRPDKDSFFSVIDTHNHFRPFGGPAVQFDTYLQWMQDAGIIFSTMFGIGQLIKKAHEEGNNFHLFYSIKALLEFVQ